MTEATKTTSAFEVQYPTVKLQTGDISRRLVGHNTQYYIQKH